MFNRDITDNSCLYCGVELPEGYGHICKLCEYKLIACRDVGVYWKPAKQKWVKNKLSKKTK